MARQQPAGGEQSSSLAVEKQGYFFVGGDYFTTDAGQLMAGQMYVEYQIPTQRKRPFPIVMWHGGGQSGACYMGTPDGREGWAQFFLKQGYTVYVVDQPGRGRSAYITSRTYQLSSLRQRLRTTPATITARPAI